ncbi:MAG: hypothetical protein ABFD60_13535 [Bryobacteraceae bacterium]
MGNRRPPIATSLKSTVTYPSALFSLERDEVLPFERFAYNVLHLAIDVLHAKLMPERVVVDFSSAANISPWTINASVKCELDSEGRPVAFRFVIPELLPSLLYIFCQKLGAELLETGTSDVRKNIQAFADGGSAGVREYKQHGLAHAIRACYEYYGFTISEYSQVQNSFDLLTKLVAYHEVGHAYADHLTCGSNINPVTRRGFELIADLLATTWFYNCYIRNTPDDSGYREARGVASHSEAIFTNCIEAQRAQLTLLTLMAFAGGQQNGGRLTVSGGISHPSGMQRHMVQHVHLRTLIESNFAHVLSKEQLATLKEDWISILECLIRSGIVPVADAMSHLDPQECDTIEAAANAIESMNVMELKPVVPFLLEIREIQADALAGRRPSFLE